MWHLDDENGTTASDAVDELSQRLKDARKFYRTKGHTEDNAFSLAIEQTALKEYGRRHSKKSEVQDDRSSYIAARHQLENLKFIKERLQAPLIFSTTMACCGVALLASGVPVIGIVCLVLAATAFVIPITHAQERTFIALRSPNRWEGKSIKEIEAIVASWPMGESNTAAKTLKIQNNVKAKGLAAVGDAEMAPSPQDGGQDILAKVAAIEEKAKTMKGAKVREAIRLACEKARVLVELVGRSRPSPDGLSPWSPVRSGLPYYLDALSRTMAKYDELVARWSGVNISPATTKAMLAGINAVSATLQKQIDELYKDDEGELATEVEVLREVLNIKF